jgi:hypothetical protein
VKKYCENRACSTYNFKVEVEEDNCIVCGRELKNADSFADLLGNIFDDAWLRKRQ